MKKESLRAYKHIVGTRVWDKILDFMAEQKYPYPWYTLRNAVDYPPGSAFEGNLVHWIANDKKRHAA